MMSDEDENVGANCQVSQTFMPKKLVSVFFLMLGTSLQVCDLRLIPSRTRALQFGCSVKMCGFFQVFSVPRVVESDGPVTVYFKILRFWCEAQLKNQLYPINVDTAQ